MHLNFDNIKMDPQYYFSFECVIFFLLDYWNKKNYYVRKL